MTRTAACTAATTTTTLTAASFVRSNYDEASVILTEHDESFRTEEEQEFYSNEARSCHYSKYARSFNKSHYYNSRGISKAQLILLVALSFVVLLCIKVEIATASPPPPSTTTIDPKQRQPILQSTTSTSTITTDDDDDYASSVSTTTATTTSTPPHVVTSVINTEAAPPPPPSLPPPPEHFEKDSVDKFEGDVKRVLYELRGDEYDPTVSVLFHSSTRPTFAVTWNHKMWDDHVSRWRYVNSFLYWHNSALLKRIIPQMTALMVWTLCSIVMVNHKITFLSDIHLPMTSLSLVSGFVGALLALRSDQGLSRMLEGRQAFGKVVFYARDLASIIRHEVYDREPEVALKCARHLALFPWLLKNFLRGTKASGGTDEDIVRAMLPKADAEYVLIQRKTPVAVISRLRQALHYLSVSKTINIADEMGIDNTIQHLDENLMMCERLVASPIPPLFTTHAGRLLVFYLFFLPFALQGSGSMSGVGTFLTVLSVGFAMLGLDEISHLLEQPFRFAPLYHLCKNTMRDVADLFCIDIPSLDDKKNRNYDPDQPTYWSGLGKTDQHDTFEPYHDKYNTTLMM